MNEQISNALLAAYTGVFYIDLVNDTFIPAKRQDQVYNMIKDIHSAQEAITTAIERTVQPEQLDNMLHLFDEYGNLTSCVWSQAFRKILGFESQKDFPNVFESWSERIHPADKDRVLNTFWNMVRTRTEDWIYDEEYRIVTKSGEYRWFRDCGRISRRKDKSVCTLDGFIVDMEEKHATCEVLCKVIEEAEKAKNRALLENEIISSVSKLYFAIFRIDLLHDFYEEVSSDNSIHLITGHSGKAQKKMNELCSTFVAPEYRDMVRKFFDLSTVGERLAHTDTIELEYHAADGNWHEARFIEKKKDEDGKVTHILYVTRIVSKEKQQELEKERLQVAYKAAESANEAKTTFLYNMSHDIRTPMNAILGYTQLMKKELHDPKLLHYQEVIEQSGNLLLSIINNVLDMARIESGKIALDENFDEAGDVIGGVCNV